MPQIDLAAYQSILIYSGNCFVFFFLVFITGYWKYYLKYQKASIFLKAALLRSVSIKWRQDFLVRVIIFSRKKLSLSGDINKGKTVLDFFV